MTPVDVAAQWQCNAETVRRLCRSGELRALRVGDLWRITPEAVAEYEARHTTSATAPASTPASKPVATTSPVAPLVYLDGALPERWWEQEQASKSAARPAAARGRSTTNKKRAVSGY